MSMVHDTDLFDQLTAKHWAVLALVVSGPMRVGTNTSAEHCMVRHLEIRDLERLGLVEVFPQDGMAVVRATPDGHRAALVLKP